MSKLSIKNLFKKKPVEDEVSAASLYGIDTGDPLENDRYRSYTFNKAEEAKYKPEYDRLIEQAKKRKEQYRLPRVTLKAQSIRKLFGVISGLLPILLIAVLFLFVLRIAPNPSSSMYPTYAKGDILLINSLSYKNDLPRRGDVVLFKRGGTTIRRIIGVPGDHIELLNGNVYVNGSVLNESYLLRNSYTLPFADGNRRTVFDVPTGMYFLLGDNRSNSADSRYWTTASGEPDPFVPLNDIYGRAIYFLHIDGKYTKAGAVRRLQYQQDVINSDQLDTTDREFDNYDAPVVTDDQVIVETLPSGER